MSSRADDYLAAMGVTAWRIRERAIADECQAEEGVTVARPRRKNHPAATSENPAQTPAEILASLAMEVASCRKCSLAGGRTQTVFGTGNPGADWMLVGEAPGAEEDRQGLPFVGRAGQLLNAMVAALHMARDDVYIANVLKCRPPNNRDPLGEEVVACMPFLRRQIALVRPRIILALGRFAAQALLATHAPISSLRGRVHHYGEFNTPLVVSYHPAYLLRSPLEKRKAWEDLKLALRTLDESSG